MIRAAVIVAAAVCWSLLLTGVLNTPGADAFLSALCVLVVLRQITARFQRGRDYRTVKARFRAAVKRSPAAMILDADWRITEHDGMTVLEQRCNHANAVEVTSLAVPGVADAERVAWWCERCSTKLPATWTPPKPPDTALVEAGRIAVGPVAHAIMTKSRRAAGWSTDPEEVRRGGHEPIEVRTMGEADVWYCPGYPLPPPVDHEAVNALLGWQLR